jgi:hypothetical protein
VPESRGKPQAVGDASVPDNPQQTVIERGLQRTIPPSPGEEGTEEALNKTRVRELCSRTRVFLGAIRNKKTRNVGRPTFLSVWLLGLLERLPESSGDLLLGKL